MEYTNNNEGHPVQESLNEYSQDPNGFNTSNDNQFGSRPSGQHMLVNSPLTVQMFEAPNTEVRVLYKKKLYKKKLYKNFIDIIFLPFNIIIIESCP